MTLSYPSLDSSNQLDGLEIVYPNGGEVLSGNVTITWTLESEYVAGLKSYTIYYSPNNGQNWILLGNAFQETNYDWKTDLYVEYGSQYRIKIVATSMEWTDKEAISESMFTIDNRETNLFGLIVAIVAIGTLGVGSYYYYTKRNKQSSFASFFQLDRPTFMKEISQKLTIGLDHIKLGFIEEPLKLPSIEIDAIIEPTSMIDYFPTDFQYDLRSEIKGRTIITLIEIAYQNPSDTNPAKIAKSLNIPQSTLSKEIKKLKELDYLQTHISKQVVLDARFRNFEITTKGFHFLSLLNTALKVTINRVKMNGRIE
jgi:DNA-binding MarR family transcriptional regulator